jgi:alpha-L-fucosidase
VDWSITNFPPHADFEPTGGDGPNDAAYSMCAYEHCMDLIERYQPDLIWNDIMGQIFPKNQDRKLAIAC